MKVIPKVKLWLMTSMVVVFLSASSVIKASEWAGLYLGKVSGQPSQLTLNRAGSDVIGVLDTDGYRYKVEGNLQKNKLIGFCRDIKTGMTGQLSAVTTKEAIILKVILPGFHRPARLVFERAEQKHTIFSQMAAR